MTTAQPNSAPRRPWHSRGFRLAMLGAALLIAAMIASSYEAPASASEFRSMIGEWASDVSYWRAVEANTSDLSLTTAELMHRKLAPHEAYLEFVGSGGLRRATPAVQGCLDAMNDAAMQTLAQPRSDAAWQRFERSAENCYEAAYR